MRDLWSFLMTPNWSRHFDSFRSIQNDLRVHDFTGWELSLDTWLYISLIFIMKENFLKNFFSRKGYIFKVEIVWEIHCALGVHSRKNSSFQNFCWMIRTQPISLLFLLSTLRLKGSSKRICPNCATFHWENIKLPQGPRSKHRISFDRRRRNDNRGEKNCIVLVLLK